MVVIRSRRVEQQQYRVDVSDGKTTANVKCLFSRTQDLLYVLLPREVRPLLDLLPELSDSTLTPLKVKIFKLGIDSRLS